VPALQRSKFILDVRGLDKQDPKAAFLKLSEEFGEIAQAMCKQDDALLLDALGDTLVCLIGVAQTNGLNLIDALGYAYDEIKDRRGLLKGDVFVKYRDLSIDEQRELDRKIDENE